MSEKFGYGLCAIESADHFFVAGVEWALEDNDVEHATIFEYSHGAWSAWSIGFRLADVALHRASSLFFAIGQTGEVEVTSSKDNSAWDERIGDSTDGPSALRPLNGACVTDQFVYAVGARRQVFRRGLATRSWHAFDAGCRVDPRSREIHAFNKIHGLQDQELFAVGLRGEIFVCRDSRWFSLDSPTNARLDSVLQVSKDRVVAGGALGTLLVGSASGFKPITHQMTDKSISSLATAFGRVFVAAEDGKLFELVGEQLAPLSVPVSSNEGGGHLAATDDQLLYSRYDVVLRYDGAVWHDVTPPDDA
jgi:hypothetical protein